MFQQGLIGLGTMEAKKAALYEDLVGAVGIETTSLLETKEFCGAAWPSK